MSPILQVLLGVGLAACCGLRTWLPLLAAGLAARFQWTPLPETFSFLGRGDVLTILAVATVVELLADKIPGIDHMLDSVSFILRPAAGAVLASALIAPSDPALSMILGLLVGGGAALSVHSAKTLLRAKSTMTSFFHGGTGNTFLSILEDLFSGFMAFLLAWSPWLLVAMALFLLGVAFCIILLAVKTGKTLFRLLFKRDKSSSLSGTASSIHTNPEPSKGGHDDHRKEC